jgi:hypothetical protein
MEMAEAWMKFKELVVRVARFRNRKYGRIKENSNFHAKWHIGHTVK